MNTATMVKLGGAGAALLAIMILSPFLFGINDAGQRTVVQYPTGKLFVKFTPGVYPQFFGSATVYVDVVTFDFDNEGVEERSSLSQAGIGVRYQDGGQGTIYGKARFLLPNDDETMLKLHKAFRNDRGVSEKLIKPVAEESLNLTAGLMTSEEAYAEKRQVFTQWAQEQIASGKFKTKLQQVYEDEVGTGQRVLRNVPIIEIGQDGKAIHLSSDLDDYGIDISGFQVTDWDFEKKTLDQIASKREATMGIITAKAEAARAEQEAITAEAKGKMAVMEAKYQKEVEKEKALVEASQTKEVAVIAAEQKVSVAEQMLLEQEQKTKTAEKYKEEQILRGAGEGEYKRLILEADGALEQKLEAYQNVMGKFAVEFGKQKWVPNIQIMNGSGEGVQANPAQDLIQLLTVSTLKDLGLSMEIPQGVITLSTPTTMPPTQ